MQYLRKFVVVLTVVAAFQLLNAQNLSRPTLILSRPVHLVHPLDRTGSALLKSATVATVPFWAGSFITSGTTYHYRMVGASPFSSDTTTTLPVVLIPLNLKFSDGVTYSGNTRVSALEASPLFKNASFSSGTTQYTDAVQRAGFWHNAILSHPNYHVRVGTPTNLATETFTVPASDGFDALLNGKPVGAVNLTWFNTTVNGVVSRAISQGVFHAQSLLVILTKDVVIFDGSPSKCCILGFHGAVSTSTAVYTYAYGPYLSQGIISNWGDITVLSHEFAEWLDDPFGNNIVPKWAQPGSGSTACFSNLLEVGDAVEALANPNFTVTLNSVTYHPQDAANLYFFSRAPKPTPAKNGLYSFAGKLSNPSSTCH